MSHICLEKCHGFGRQNLSKYEAHGSGDNKGILESENFGIHCLSYALPLTGKKMKVQMLKEVGASMMIRCFAESQTIFD